MTEPIEDTDLEQDAPEPEAEAPAEPTAVDTSLDTNGELLNKVVFLADGKNGIVIEENASMVLVQPTPDSGHETGWQHRGNITSVSE